MITLNLCLSDIPKEKIFTSENNGKKYISLVVDERKEPSQYGETHTLYISQTKEQREAKENKVYVGGGKEYKFDKQTTIETKTEIKQIEQETDLPF